MGGRGPPAAGAVVVRREPGNLVGWLLSALGLSVVLARPLEIYADSRFRGDGLPAAAVGVAAGEAYVLPIVYQGDGIGRLAVSPRSPGATCTTGWGRRCRDRPAAGRGGRSAGRPRRRAAAPPARARGPGAQTTNEVRRLVYALRPPQLD